MERAGKAAIEEFDAVHGDWSNIPRSISEAAVLPVRWGLLVAVDSPCFVAIDNSLDWF